MASIKLLLNLLCLSCYHRLQFQLILQCLYSTVKAQFYYIYKQKILKGQFGATNDVIPLSYRTRTALATHSLPPSVHVHNYMKDLLHGNRTTTGTDQHGKPASFLTVTR